MRRDQRGLGIQPKIQQQSHTDQDLCEEGRSRVSEEIPLANVTNNPLEYGIQG